jgi:hypothetical protein
MTRRLVGFYAQPPCYNPLGHFLGASAYSYTVATSGWEWINSALILFYENVITTVSSFWVCFHGPSHQHSIIRDFLDASLLAQCIQLPDCSTHMHCCSPADSIAVILTCNDWFCDISVITNLICSKDTDLHLSLSFIIINCADHLHWCPIFVGTSTYIYIYIYIYIHWEELSRGQQAYYRAIQNCILGWILIPNQCVYRL